MYVLYIASYIYIYMHAICIHVNVIYVSSMCDRCMRKPKETLKIKNMRLDALIFFLIEWPQQALILRGNQSKYRNQTKHEQKDNAPWCTDHFSYWMTTPSIYFEGYTLEILKPRETWKNKRMHLDALITWMYWSAKISKHVQKYNNDETLIIL